MEQEHQEIRKRIEFTVNPMFFSQNFMPYFISGYISFSIRLLSEAVALFVALTSIGTTESASLTKKSISTVDFFGRKTIYSQISPAFPPQHSRKSHLCKC